MGTGLVLLVAYLLVALGTFVSDGLYDPLALLLVSAGFALLVAAFAMAWRRDGPEGRMPRVPLLAAGLLALLAVALTKSAGLYIRDPLYDRLYAGWLIALAVLAAAAYLVARGRPPRARFAVFLAAALVAAAFRLWIPLASPSPAIDVFSMSQQSAAHLLGGRDPYSAPVTDVYEGRNDPRFLVKAYVYSPAALYLQTLAYAATRDVRYASVFAELAVAFALWKLARRRWGDPVAELVTLLFLYNPRALFVIEQGWIDPLILALLGTFLLLREGGRRGAASAAYGFTLALKQNMAFAWPLWLIIERDWRRVLTGLAVAALTFLPFLVIGPKAFIENGVLLTALVPFRDDTLTVTSLLARTWGFRPPPGWTAGIGTVLTVVAFLPQKRIEPLRGYLFAIATVTFGMFLLGTATFCNWYYLVAGLLLFLLAAGDGRAEPGAPGTGTFPAVATAAGTGPVAVKGGAR